MYVIIQKGFRLYVSKYVEFRFLKTLYKISALFQISSEIKKGAAQISHESGKSVFNRFLNQEEINGNSQIRVNILP